MRNTRVGYGLYVLVLWSGACGETKPAGAPPQAQEPSDATSTASSPPVESPVESTGPGMPAMRPASPAVAMPRDAEAPSSPRDAMPLAAADASPSPRPNEPLEDDAGTPVDAGAQPHDAAADAPVACSPDQPPLHASACAIEGDICAHWSTDSSTGYDNYFACLCIAASSTRLAWNCYEGLSGSVQCPHERPAAGSSCYGFKSQTCPYPPRVSCACPIEGTNPRWDCSEPLSAPEAPATLPITTAVRDLDDAGRRAFCEWYVDQTVEDGFPQPPEPLPTPDGYQPTSGCSGCGGGLGFGGMSPSPLPVSACVANLGLSTCELPLSELIDCVRSMWSQCWPTPRGCARYLESPGCSGTLVVKIGSAFPIDCRIKVR